jgi:hypothetical protein
MATQKAGHDVDSAEAAVKRRGLPAARDQIGANTDQPSNSTTAPNVDHESNTTRSERMAVSGGQPRGWA